MTNPLRLLALAYLALVVVFAAPPSAAAPPRTFVSTGGNDANPCSLVAPCRGFAAAVAAVSAGGEVIVLDSGGYGAVTIDKSVTIAAPAGVYAGISIADVSCGITIAAGATDTVALRNLTLIGRTPRVALGACGVRASSVGELRIDGLRISGSGASGLSFESGTLTVANSIVEGYLVGIAIASAGASATVVVHDTQLTGNDVGYGQYGLGTTHASVTRVNASANTGIGFIVDSTASNRLVLESCVAAENGSAGVAQTSGVVVLSGNSITGNGTGVDNSFGSGTAYTRGNNTIVQNGTDVSGTLTPIPGGGT